MAKFDTVGISSADKVRLLGPEFQNIEVLHVLQFEHSMLVIAVIEGNVVNLSGHPGDALRTYLAALKDATIPNSGDGIHPRTRKIISYDRTDWIEGRLKPRSAGVYERQFNEGSTTTAFFAYWDGEKWSERKRHLDELVVRSYVRNAKQSSKQHLPWRGLSRDPEAQYVTYHAAPRLLRDEFEFGGYVAQPETGTQVVRIIHVAKLIRTPDGEHLTACGYRAPKGRALELWGDQGLRIMVRDGTRPELCLACQSIAFSDF